VWLAWLLTFISAIGRPATSIRFSEQFSIAFLPIATSNNKEDRDMSKGQKRSGREEKKPKQNKPKLAAAATTTPTVLEKFNPLRRGKQK
jgi:hypothetical protein